MSCASSVALRVILYGRPLSLLVVGLVCLYVCSYFVGEFA